MAKAPQWLLSLGSLLVTLTDQIQTLGYCGLAYGPKIYSVASKFLQTYNINKAAKHCFLCSVIEQSCAVLQALQDLVHIDVFLDE